MHIANNKACEWCKEHGEVYCMRSTEGLLLSMSPAGHVTIHNMTLLPQIIVYLSQLISEEQEQLLRTIDRISLYSVMSGSIAEQVKSKVDMDKMARA